MRGFLVSFGGGALGAVLVVVLHSIMVPPLTFVSVDVQRLLTAHIAELGNQTLDAETQKRDAAAYASALEAALDDIANREHSIVLVSPAVLRGAPDVTDALRASIEQRLGALSSVSKGRVP